MIPAATAPCAATPGDPVRTALADGAVRVGLLNHARAVLGRGAAGRPESDVHETAEEVVQEACSRACEKTAAFDPASGSVTGWLHGIVNKVLLEMGRFRACRPTQPPDDLATWERLAVDLTPSPDHTVADRLDARSYLSRLPAEHRSIVELRFRESLDHSEIAARLGISVGAARVRLCRALAALKEIAGVAREEDGR